MPDTPQVPDRVEHYAESHQPTLLEFRVNELTSDQAGGLSPFGDEVDFPMPLDKIRYSHPAPSDRPNLAGGY